MSISDQVRQLEEELKKTQDQLIKTQNELAKAREDLVKVLEEQRPKKKAKKQSPNSFIPSCKNAGKDSWDDGCEVCYCPYCHD